MNVLISGGCKNGKSMYAQMSTFMPFLLLLL